MAPIAKFIERNPDGGMHHLCFEVDDILTAREALKATGARVLGDGKVLYENPDARGDQPPIDVDVLLSPHHGSGIIAAGAVDGAVLNTAAGNGVPSTPISRITPVYCGTGSDCCTFLPSSIFA